MQLRVLSGSTTKPSRHWHTTVSPTDSHCVVNVSQLCDPSAHGCMVGRWLGASDGVPVGANDGGTVGLSVGVTVGAAVGAMVATHVSSPDSDWLATKPSKHEHLYRALPIASHRLVLVSHW